jgi:hypothetical protein
MPFISNLDKISKQLQQELSRYPQYAKSIGDSVDILRPIVQFAKNTIFENTFTFKEIYNSVSDELKLVLRKYIRDLFLNFLPYFGTAFDRFDFLGMEGIDGIMGTFYNEIDKLLLDDYEHLQITFDNAKIPSIEFYKTLFNVIKEAFVLFKNFKYTNGSNLLRDMNNANFVTEYYQQFKIYGADKLLTKILELTQSLQLKSPRLSQKSQSSQSKSPRLSQKSQSLQSKSPRLSQKSQSSQSKSPRLSQKRKLSHKSPSVQSKSNKS